ncbi:DUF397 domain-containing protein [Streptacidiphilus albus]|uniref:DUF397 domain-containing protein n=1 Tax=Streptacidiphilus albus TaxID=105425 RepID=UPI0005A725AE|nr:DUF397 domain-containing protein [Streptacidiphilus albus]
MSTTPDRKEALYALDLTDAQWRTSPLTGNGADCVEITDLPDGGIAVRDSKNPDRPDLRFNAREWAAFTGGLKQNWT